MPKSKKDAVHRHFTFDEETNCSKCNLCDAKIKGQHATNLKNHMSVKHKEQFKDVLLLNKENIPPPPVGRKKKDTVIEIIKKNCLKLVTVHGRPFQLIEDKAFQDIIGLAIKDMNQANTINIQNIKSMIADKAHEIKLKISNELRDRLICVKLDSASYLDRAFLGINVQYIKNGKIIIRTLATEEVFRSQTGEHLKEILLDVLLEYRIDFSQIYAITTDNGRNFKKMVTLLGGSYNFITIDEDLQTNTDSENEEDEIYSDRENTFISNYEAQIDNLVSALNENVTESSFSPRTMLCAAHTLQLAIKDGLQANPEVQNVLYNAREIVKILRTPTIRNVLRQANLKKPIIDCPTRWSSTYNMLVRLVTLKSICLDDSNMRARLNEASWQIISDLVDCLKPLYETTIKLQKEQLTLGDFFIEWLTCKGHLEQCRTEISQTMLQCMKSREVHLLNTKLMLEALYMDVRLNIILSDAEAEKAQQLLLETLQQINKIKHPIESTNEFTSGETSTIDDEAIASCSSAPSAKISFAEKILRTTELHKGIGRQRNSRSMDVALKEIRRIPRLHSSENILQYWTNKLTSELSELALCVLAAPATQVSVERIFSSVKFILSPLRSNLSRSTLENIMVIRSNQDLFD